MLRSGEDLQNFLISVRQECCHLTEVIQDVINRFPRQTSQVCPLSVVQARWCIVFINALVI